MPNLRNVHIKAPCLGGKQGDLVMSCRAVTASEILRVRTFGRGTVRRNFFF